MSEQRIVVETPCRHDNVLGYHSWYLLPSELDREVAAGRPAVGFRECPGGSRRTVELPDMEKLREAVEIVAGHVESRDNVWPVAITLAEAARWVLNLTEEE